MNWLIPPDPRPWEESDGDGRYTCEKCGAWGAVWRLSWMDRGTPDMLHFCDVCVESLPPETIAAPVTIACDDDGWVIS